MTYSKIQMKVCRTPKATPMDWFFVKAVNPEYPLSHHECVEKYNLFPMAYGILLYVSYLPPKLVPLYSLFTAYLSSNPNIGVSAHSYWDIFDFLKAPNFGKIFKWSSSCQKLTKKGPRRCFKLSGNLTKNSNGKCPKLPIRHFRVPCY